MNSKTGIAVVVGALLLLGAFVMVKNSQQSSQVNQSESTSIESQRETTSEKKEDEDEDREKMMEKEEDKETTTVEVTNTGFEPQTVIVKVGTKVTWVNKTSATADVSSVKHPTHLVYPPLNLGNFEPGASVSLLFNQSGEYKYHNHLNPTQFGTVIVE